MNQAMLEVVAKTCAEIWTQWTHQTMEMEAAANALLVHPTHMEALLAKEQDLQMQLMVTLEGVFRPQLQIELVPQLQESLELQIASLHK
eukprot:SAG11_NODE_1201_length_5538_cov_2.793896_4_plen_89_part_00